MKKVAIILLIAIVIFMFIYNMDFKESNNKNSQKMFTVNDGEAAIKAIQGLYGTDTARIIERIMRLETAHFSSKQYQLTGSAGMEAGKWKDLPKGLKTIDMRDAHDKHVGHFIVWNSVSQFAVYLKNYIDRHNGNWAAWNSLDPTKQANYMAAVNSVTPKFA